MFQFYSIDRTFKMYYGGAQKRPDAPYVRPVSNPSGQVMGHVGEGNRKDIRNAVEAAHKAAPGYAILCDICYGHSFIWFPIYIFVDVLQMGKESSTQQGTDYVLSS